MDNRMKGIIKAVFGAILAVLISANCAFADDLWIVPKTSEEGTVLPLKDPADATAYVASVVHDQDYEGVSSSWLYPDSNGKIDIVRDLLSRHAGIYIRAKMNLDNGRYVFNRMYLEERHYDDGVIDWDIDGEGGNHDTPYVLSTTEMSDGRYRITMPKINSEDDDVKLVIVYDEADIPVASAEPASVDYASIIEGSESAKTITLSNSGNGELTLSGMSLSDNGNFSLDVNRPAEACGSKTPVISPDAHCRVNVIFQPSAPGDYDATFSIQSDDPDNPVIKIPLSGVSIRKGIILTAEQEDDGMGVLFSAEPVGVMIESFKWFIGENLLKETLDNEMFHSFDTGGDYSVKVAAVDTDGDTHEKTIDITVYSTDIEGGTLRFEPVFPKSDAEPSHVMQGGKAYRYYSVYGENDQLLSNTRLLFHTTDGSDGLRDQTGQIDREGILGIYTPYTGEDTHYEFSFSKADGTAIKNIIDPPSFEVVVSDRVFSEEHRILVGLGVSIGVGAGFKLKAVDLMAASAGIGVGRNVINTIYLDNMGDRTDATVENILGAEVGFNLEAANAEIFEGFIGEFSPEFGIEGSGKAAFNWGVRYHLEDFFNSRKEYHDEELLAGAALFLGSIVNGLNISSVTSNPTLIIVLTEVLNRITPARHYYEGSSFNVTLQGSGSTRLTPGLDKLPFINNFVSLDLSLFDGEYVYALDTSVGKDTIEAISQKVAWELDVLNLTGRIPFAEFDLQEFLGINILDLNVAEDIITCQANSDITGGKRIQLKRLVEREEEPYAIGSQLDETHITLSTKDAFSAEDVISNAPMAEQMDTILSLIPLKRRNVIEDVYYSLGFNPAAYNKTYDAMFEIGRGEVEFQTLKKNIKRFSFDVDFEVALELKLGLNLKLDLESAYEYLAQKATILPGGKIYPSEAYEADEYITEEIKGVESIIQEYIDIINNIIEIENIAETVIEVFEAGVDFFLETASQGAGEIGAFLRASGEEAGNIIEDAGDKIEGAISTVGDTLDSIFRIHARDSADATAAYVATMISDTFIVNIRTDDGMLLEEFPEIEFGIEYNEEMLTAAGLELSDASKLSIYRWNGNCACFVHIGGTVNESEQYVSAKITRPGQYVLAIDEVVPQIVNFDVSDGTPMPTISFIATDLVTGLDLSNFSFDIDGINIIDETNYQAYIDAFTGSFSYTVEEPLAEGEHTLSILLTDTAGNAEEFNYTFDVNTVSPSIEHTAINRVTSGDEIDLTANVTDDNGLSGAFLYYRPKHGELPYRGAAMVDDGTDAYSAAIPREYVTAYDLRYFLRAVDESGNVTETDPMDISVEDVTAPEMEDAVFIIAETESYKVNWKKPDDVDLAGYRIYIGDSEDSLELYRDKKDGFPRTHIDPSHKGRLISITAYDASGNESRRSEPAAIAPEECDAVASFTFTTNALTATFDVSDAEGEISFDYGDGEEGTALTHTYASPGTYSVTLYATDPSTQCVEMAARSVTVESPYIPPACNAYAQLTIDPESGAAPLTVTFDTANSAGSLAFDYGDDTTGTEMTHTYAEAGSYIVTLTATDGACRDTAAANIEVAESEEPTPNPTPVPCAGNLAAAPQSGQAPLTVIFSMEEAAEEMAIDYGDGTSGTDPRHTYTEAGTYTATLNTTEDTGCLGPPTALITVSEAEQNRPPEKPVLSVDGNGALILGEYADEDNDALESVIWQVQDEEGPVFRLENGSRTLLLPELFLTPGKTYLASAQFTDARGAVSEWADPVTITGERPYGDENGDGIPDARTPADPAADFPNLSPETTRFVSFQGDDGIPMPLGLERGRNVDAIPALRTLQPKNLSETGRPALMPAGLVNFKMNVSPGGVAQAVIHFPQTLPSDAKWYAYDEIDGSFSEYGYATVSEDRTSVALEFEDGGFGDRDGVENGVIVVPPSGYGIDALCSLAVFSADPRSGEEPLMVILNAQGSVGDLTWDFGDGSEAAQGPETFHTYTEAGTYTITLTATGADGCTHTAKQTIEVAPASPSVPDEGDEGEAEPEDDGGNGDSNCFISTSAVES